MAAIAEIPGPATMTATRARDAEGVGVAKQDNNKKSSHNAAMFISE